jgi:hypothetical protein
VKVFSNVCVYGYIVLVYIHCICMGRLYLCRYIVFLWVVFCNVWVYGICVGILYLCKVYYNCMGILFLCGYIVFV